jgi:hypothetical protein
VNGEWSSAVGLFYAKAYGILSKTTPSGRGAKRYVAALMCFSLFSRPMASQQSHGLWPWFFTKWFAKNYSSY